MISGALAIFLSLIAVKVLIGRNELLLFSFIFCMTEVVGQRVIIFWEQVALAKRHLRTADLIRLAAPAIRVFSMWAFIQLSCFSAFGNVIVGYAVSSVGAALIFTLIFVYRYGPPQRGGNTANIFVGAPFALNQLLRASQYNVDRIVLGVVLGRDELAIYASAMRFIQVGTLPVTTLLRSTYPQLFASTRNGAAGAWPIIKWALPVAISLAIVSTAMLLLTSQFFPILLGDKYRYVGPLTRRLSPIMLISAVSYLGADVLTVTGRPYFRVTLLFLAFLVQASVTLFLCRRYHLNGAVASLLISNFLFGAAAWFFASRAMWRTPL